MAREIKFSNYFINKWGFIVIVQFQQEMKIYTLVRAAINILISLCGFSVVLYFAWIMSINWKVGINTWKLNLYPGNYY